ncbi:hypothetical protein ACOSQ2_008863 [Xanthoceras sorbifolium]
MSSSQQVSTWSLPPYVMDFDAYHTLHLGAFPPNPTLIAVSGVLCNRQVDNAAVYPHTTSCSRAVMNDRS